MGIKIYIDDNADYLPGPLFLNQQSGYDNGTPFYLPYYLWNYFGMKDHSVTKLRGGLNKCDANKIFTCPSLMATTPKPSPNQLPGDRTNFMINGADVLPERGAGQSKAFGYPINASPPAPATKPLREAVVLTVTNRGSFFTLRDVDQQIDGSISPPTWHLEIPSTPVHGRSRNWMFLDWHVESTSRTNFF